MDKKSKLAAIAATGALALSSFGALGAQCNPCETYAPKPEPKACVEQPEYNPCERVVCPSCDVDFGFNIGTTLDLGIGPGIEFGPSLEFCDTFKISAEALYYARPELAVDWCTPCQVMPSIYLDVEPVWGAQLEFMFYPTT